ncbi:hypothetical protein [Rhodococcus erythropolis]|uniref:hypothetical protein n=1 Tax=Rhodococcus erythropolis TaxID=1833 RepID=UPI00366F9407
MSYVVVAPLVGVNGADGKLKYLYQDAAVPLDVSEADVARLAAGGLIEEVASPEKAPVKATPKKPAGASSDGTT